MASICRSDILEELFGTSQFTYEAHSEWRAQDSRRRAIGRPTKISIPYRADGIFEQALPSVADVVRGQNISDHERGPAFVRKVGPYAVKFSVSTSILQEAENLLFLEANSKVRAPKVFAVFSHHGEHPLGWFKGHEITFHYLVMEYLPGNPLTSERFKSYDSTTQRIIGSKIAEQLKQLREVEQLESSPYYGRINKQGWSRDFRMFVCPGRTTCRPYESYREFIDAMFYCARYCAATGPSNFQEPFRGGTKFTLANFRHSLMGVAEEDQRPTLTHLDLKFENILVQETGDDYVVTLIDWEYCGWMPAWIEGVTAMSRPLVYDITERRNLTWEISQGIQPLNLAAARFLVSCFEDLQYCLV